MRSWDCWDTLIARRTISDVRDETDNVFPIMENVARVQPEDILVSDFYDADLLRRLIPEITGLQNRLFITPDGKRTGQIWRSLRHLGLLEHTGDDWICDVSSPQRYGIAARHCHLAQFTAAEEEINSFGLSGLARSMREARLIQRPLEHHPFDTVQTQVNFPLLFVAAIILHRLNPMRDTGRLLMSSRDCFLWLRAQELVRDLHGANYELVYFLTSRIARAFPSVEYLRYVNKNLPAAVVDIGGTGWSLARLIERTDYPRTPITLIERYELPDLVAQYETIGKTLTKCKIQTLLHGPAPPADIEVMNLARHPMFIDHTTAFNPLGYRWEQAPEIEAMHAGFLRVARVTSHYDFSSDICASDQRLQAALKGCFLRASSYAEFLNPLQVILAQENLIVMQRLKELSASPPQFCANFRLEET
jgi:hypothetical protein